MKQYSLGWKYSLHPNISRLELFSVYLSFSDEKIVGYLLSATPNVRFAKDTLDNAIKRQQLNTEKLMIHSDQGVQYSAKEFRNRLSELNITQSIFVLIAKK